MRYIITVLLAMGLIAFTPSKTPPVHINKSESVVTAQSTESVKQPPSNSSGQVITPVAPEIKALEQKNSNVTNPQEPPKTGATVAVQEPIVSTPEATAKATLEDLGQGDAWYAMQYIGNKESSWNPHAINSIGACGLFQALPCSKLPCDLSDVDCQVRWATEYATQRYGSWHNAYQFWLQNNWW